MLKPLASQKGFLYSDLDQFLCSIMNGGMRYVQLMKICMCCKTVLANFSCTSGLITKVHITLLSSLLVTKKKENFKLHLLPEEDYSEYCY